MASSKPAVLLIHGAWHPPVFYDNLRTRLGAMGYEYICPHLPSLGPNSQGVDLQADIDAIRKIAIDLFDQGKEVVIIGHSAGGVPACAATEGLDVAQRAREGKKGGFRHIIFLTAFAVPVHGTSLLKILGGTMPEWQNAGEPGAKGNLNYLRDAAKDIMYNGLTDEEAREYFKLCQPHSQDAFQTTVNFIPADVTFPKTYIVCEQDRAIPADAQRQLASGPGFKVETMNSGHSPFLTQPDECAQLLRKVIEA